MKKLILAAFALTAAVSVFAQGTVIFNTRLTSTTHVWGPSTTAPSLSLVGLGSNDSPSGQTAFAASGMTMIGQAGTVGRYGAASTFAQLIGAAGTGVGESSLIPLGQTTTFRTGGAAGNIAQITDTLSGATPIGPDAASATFEMVAWDNLSGLYPTWTQASVAWQEGLIAAGKSAIFTVNAIGGTANVAPNTVMTSSFNLYMVPEPSSFALAGLGIAALVAFRRRNS